VSIQAHYPAIMQRKNAVIVLTEHRPPHRGRSRDFLLFARGKRNDPNLPARGVAAQTANLSKHHTELVERDPEAV
jgi:hypothetical protein